MNKNSGKGVMKKKHGDFSAYFKIPKYLKTVVPFTVPVSTGEKNATKREEENLLN